MKPFRFTLASAALTVAVMAAPVNAQEIDPAADKAARAAIAATKATDSFDIILPKAALDLKNGLSRNNPDKSEQIDLMVDEEALKLAGRRGDLEREAVKLFDANFTTEELNEIATFFSSETGQKYLSKTPILARELSKASRVWAGGIRRDLGEAASKKMVDILAQ